jgi:hypothetical protein
VVKAAAGGRCRAVKGPVFWCEPLSTVAAFDFGCGPDFNGEIRPGSREFAEIVLSMKQVNIIEKTTFMRCSFSEFS